MQTRSSYLGWFLCLRHKFPGIRTCSRKMALIFVFRGAKKIQNIKCFFMSFESFFFNESHGYVLYVVELIWNLFGSCIVLSQYVGNQYDWIILLWLGLLWATQTKNIIHLSMEIYSSSNAPGSHYEQQQKPFIPRYGGCDWEQSIPVSPGPLHWVTYRWCDGYSAAYRVAL